MLPFVQKATGSHLLQEPPLVVFSGRGIHGAPRLVRYMAVNNGGGRGTRLHHQQMDDEARYQPFTQQFAL